MKWITSVTVALSGILALASAASVPSVLGPIKVGVEFNDTKGRLVQAHSGGVYHDEESDLYYLYGNNYTGDTTSDPFTGVTLYSSYDFSHWDYVKNLVTPDTPGWNTPSNTTGCLGLAVVERPKVIYNEQTRKYVMYMHVTDPTYSNTMLGVATSGQFLGPWEFVSCYRPGGLHSWDMGVYVDDDDDRTAYVIYSSDANGTGTNGALRISQLSSDYLTVAVPDVATGRGQLEAPGIIKYDGIYTLVVSHTSGWSSNPNVYNQATKISELLSGNFTNEIAPASANTYNSQNAYLLTINNKKHNTFIYLGDRYEYPELSVSEYVWLPVNVTKDTFELVYFENEWYLDVESGFYFGH